MTLLAAAGGSEQYNVLSAIPHEIVFGLIAFGVLFLLMSRVLLPRLDAIYAERNDRIEGGFERAEQARAEAGRARAEYRTRLGEAREEATAIRDAAREEGRRATEETLARAREEAGRVVAEGRDELTGERRRLASDLEPDIARLSRELAGRILGREVGADEHRDTVDSYLGSQRA